MIPRTKERIGGESLKEQLSRAAEQELREYLATGGGSQPVLRFLPVPVQTTPPVSLEWDREEEEPYAINEEAAAAEAGALSGRRQGGEKKRKRKKRVKPYIGKSTELLTFDFQFCFSKNLAKIKIYPF